MMLRRHSATGSQVASTLPATEKKKGVTLNRGTVSRDASVLRFRATSLLDVVRVWKAGGGLLSHDLAIAVPSALTGLTTVFGMGTGVALSR